MRVERPSALLREPEPKSFTGRVPDEFEAWVGFGGNLGERMLVIEAALSEFGSAVQAVSPIFETAPWGVLDQPWFLNGVVRLYWRGSPEALLARCLETEQKLGRVRKERNGPRIIDLDVLILGPRSYSAPGLTLPHSGIASRRSVLEPWAALSPDLVVPGLVHPVGVLRDRARGLPGQEVRRFEGGC